MKNLSILICLCFLLFSCKKKNNSPTINCDKIGILDSDGFRNAPKDPFTFISAEINGDCMEITVEYGGGCGEVDFQLFGQEEVAQSLPPQRLILLSLDDNDLCKALIKETIFFDLTNLREENYDEVQLILDGLSRTPLLYKY